MKLSDLVHYRNQLDLVSADPLWRDATAGLNIILHLISSHNLQIGEFTKQLTDNHDTVRDSFTNFEQTLTHLKSAVNQLIEDAEKPWFAESYRLYDQEMANETVDNLSFRKPNLPAETEMFYRTRIMRYTGWQYSAMIIRPGVETYINDMVDCDPLYLVDVKHELLEPAMNLHNETYRRRLRPYVVTENQDTTILDRLPNTQFGVIFAYNFFNFRPLEIIRQWLTELYQKLKPGGMLLMTINDCDRYKGVMLVEQHFCCYTPGKLICDLANSIGFETAFTWHDDGPNTWLELRRPGQLTSLRGGQALAKVNPKPLKPPTEEELAHQKLFFRAVEHHGMKAEGREYSSEELLEYISGKTLPK